MDIVTQEDIQTMNDLFNKHRPIYGAFDTETNGLHIIQSKPFLIQFGYVNIQTMKGYVWAADIRTQVGLQAAQ